MDLPTNKIHRILLDAGLPSTVEDLKTPTEDYIVNLITTFASQFGIDINLIDQPTVEQHNAMTYFEDCDIINLINLHTAMTQIFDQIFLHDFCISDITSPGPKRLRKQAKFLGNFMLYAMSKRAELQDRVDSIQARTKMLEELREKRMQIKEAINMKVSHKAQQLSLLKKLKSDLQNAQSRIENNNKRGLELDVEKHDLEMKHQKVKERHTSIKTEAVKLSKVIAELQSEIVHSPEEYQTHLTNLEEQKSSKMDERNVMQEAIQSKKQSIKEIGSKLNFVEKMNEELSTLKITHKQLQNQKAQSDDIKKQIDSMKDLYNEQQNKLMQHKDQVTTEVNELQSYRQKEIAPLTDLSNQLLSEKKLKKSELEAAEIVFNDKCLQRNKLQENIKKIEEETTAFIQSCQELYDKDVADELKLQEACLGEY